MHPPISIPLLYDHVIFLSQSSMLQSVIRNLVDSVDEEDRVSQRNKLEDDLNIASERLDALVQGVEEQREGGKVGGREGGREREKKEGEGKRKKGQRKSIACCETLAG